MTQMLERDVVAALGEVKSVCSEQVYELLDMVLNNNARTIASLIAQVERLQNENIALMEKTGSDYFNTITYGRKTTPDETGHIGSDA